MAASANKAACNTSPVSTQAPVLEKFLAHRFVGAVSRLSKHLMIQYTRWAQAILGLCCTLMYCTGSAFANGGPSTLFHEEVAYDALFWNSSLFAEMFLATVAVEYAVVYFMLGRPAKASMQLLGWVLFVNVITNPAAQLGLLCLGDPVLWGSDTLAWVMIGIVELIVVAVEFCLLKWIFGRMNRRGRLDEPVSTRRTFAIALVANAASFVCGIVGFFLWYATISS
jgi:hypothetical protein